jgi:MFS family permease
VALSDRTFTSNPVDRRTRYRWAANGLLSHSLSTFSGYLATAFLIVLFVVCISGRLAAFRWLLLLLALTYFVLGSLMRAAAISQPHVWIDLDAIRLWQAIRTIALRGATATGAGTFVGCLVSAFVVLAEHKHGQGALRLIGNAATVGAILGAVLAVLTMPQLAYARRRELRRQDKASS